LGRNGYFYVDPLDSKPEKPVFNRTATLRNTWTASSLQRAGTHKKSKPKN